MSTKAIRSSFQKNSEYSPGKDLKIKRLAIGKRIRLDLAQKVQFLRTRACKRWKRKWTVNTILTANQKEVSAYQLPSRMRSIKKLSRRIALKNLAKERALKEAWSILGTCLTPCFFACLKLMSYSSSCKKYTTGKRKNQSWARSILYLPTKNSSISPKISSLLLSRSCFSSALNFPNTRLLTRFWSWGLSIPILILQKSRVQSFSMVLFSPLCPAGLPPNLRAILPVVKSISSWRTSKSLDGIS